MIERNAKFYDYFNSDALGDVFKLIKTEPYRQRGVSSSQTKVWTNTTNNNDDDEDDNRQKCMCLKKKPCAVVFLAAAFKQ